jgi:hypothetical protein
MPQTTYAAKQALAYLGMIVDAREDNIVESRAAATAGVHVGSLVIGGPTNPNPPAPGQCQELADGAGAIAAGLVGVALYDSTRMPYATDASTKALYSGGDMVPILTRGGVWVWTEVATAVTDPVFVRVLLAGANVKGQFTNGATTNFIAAPAGWKWKTSTSGAGLIHLEIR